MVWVLACRKEDLEEESAIRLDTVPPIALYFSEGEYFATADICSHQVASLSEGYVENGTVECPAHFAQFCLRTGKALSMPAKDPVAVYQVKQENDDLYVFVP